MHGSVRPGAESQIFNTGNRIENTPTPDNIPDLGRVYDTNDIGAG
jgi:hypothetical protein